MQVSDIQEDMNEAGMLRKSFTTRKFATLLNMYGEEFDIIKGAERGSYVRVTNEGLVLRMCGPTAQGSSMLTVTSPLPSAENLVLE